MRITTSVASARRAGLVDAPNPVRLAILSTINTTMRRETHHVSIAFLERLFDRPKRVVTKHAGGMQEPFSLLQDL